MYALNISVQYPHSASECGFIGTIMFYKNPTYDTFLETLGS